MQDDLCAYHEEHDAFPVDGEDPMGEGYVRKKIPKNKLWVGVDVVAFSVAMTDFVLIIQHFGEYSSLWSIDAEEFHVLLTAIVV